MLIKLKAGVWVKADEIAAVRVKQTAIPTKSGHHIQHSVEFLLRGFDGTTIHAQCNTELEAIEAAEKVVALINGGT